MLFGHCQPYFIYRYAVSFGVLTGTIVHVALWHWSDIKKAMATQEHDDHVYNRQDILLHRHSKIDRLS